MKILLMNSRPVFQLQNPEIGDAQSQDFWTENVAGIRYAGIAMPRCCTAL